MISFRSPLKSLYLVLCILSGLTACGGGGSGGNGGGFETNTPNTKPQASSESSQASVSSASTSSKATSANSSISQAQDLIAPNIPANFRVESTKSDRVILVWEASKDNRSSAVSYKIYRDQVQIDLLRDGETTYYDFDVAPSKSYTYGISAGDNLDNWSTLTNTTARTADFVGASSTSSSANSSVKLSSASSSISWVSSNSSMSSSTSSSKASSSTDTTSPSAPAQLTKVSALSSQVELSWSTATDNVGVTAYRIYRDTILLKTVTADINNYIDKTVLPNASYWYGVSAGDAAGNWSPQTLLNIKTPNVLVSGNVTLKWIAPTQRENLKPLSPSEIGGYEVRYRGLLENTYKYKTLAKELNQLSLTGLTGDYVFEIAVFDTNNLYSNFISINPI